MYAGTIHVSLGRVYLVSVIPHRRIEKSEETILSTEENWRARTLLFIQIEGDKLKTILSIS